MNKGGRVVGVNKNDVDELPVDQKDSFVLGPSVGPKQAGTTPRSC